MSKMTAILDLKFVLKQENERDTTIVEVLKNTVVTVTLVNRNRKRNDDIDRNYVRMLPFVKSNVGTCSFHEHQFIHAKDMFANDETGTCYFEDGTFEFVINLYLPHVVTLNF